MTVVAFRQTHIDILANAGNLRHIGGGFKTAISAFSFEASLWITLKQITRVAHTAKQKLRLKRVLGKLALTLTNHRAVLRFKPPSQVEGTHGSSNARPLAAPLKDL